MYLRKVAHQFGVRVKRLLPCFHKSHMQNLALLVIGIAYSRSVSLPKVAGDHAFYFKGNDLKALANAIEEWLALHDKKNHPKSHDMPWLTWEESAATLLQCLLGEDYRLNERCSSERRLWEDSQRDRQFVGAPCMRQNASMLGDEAVNQLTI